MGAQIDITREHETGFRVDEQNLRRTFEAMVQRLLQQGEEDALRVSIEVGLEDGTTHHLGNVDDVVAIENRKPARVHRLKMKVEMNERDRWQAPHSIEVAFGSNRPYGKPVTYQIRSDDRDWAALAERDVRECVHATFVPRHRVGGWGVAVVALVMLSIVALVTRALLKDVPSLDHAAEMQKLLADWEAHRVSDPVSAFLRLELAKERHEASPAAVAAVVLFFLGTIVVFAAALTDAPQRLYDWFRPPHRFAWQHQAGELARRDNLVNVVIVGFVLCGIVAGLVGAWLQRLIGL